MVILRLHRAGFVLIAAYALFSTAPSSPLHAHERPLGDGKISSSPRQGHLMSCQTRFNPNAPGSRRTGSWVRGGSYFINEKPVVDGQVTWPSEISVALEGDRRNVRANNLPDHPTGVFPVSRSDDAFAYDRNPNPIRPQTILLSLPANPQPAASPSCVPMGMIGFMLSGGALYNAVDARGRDAPAYEMQDACSGHPQQTGQYHYHDRSACLKDTRSQPGGHSDLVGYALDGFGIFGIHGEGGKVMTNADLDACHGHSHVIEWNGRHVEMYHYHLTDQYPYSIGCYRGTPIEVSGAMSGQSGRGRPPEGRPGGGQRPPGFRRGPPPRLGPPPRRPAFDPAG
ncbi:MAG: YHYH protein [Pseudomonadota bacterium]